MCVRVHMCVHICECLYIWRTEDSLVTQESSNLLYWGRMSHWPRLGFLAIEPQGFAPHTSGIMSVCFLMWGIGWSSSSCACKTSTCFIHWLSHLCRPVSVSCVMISLAISLSSFLYSVVVGTQWEHRSEVTVCRPCGVGSKLCLPDRESWTKNTKTATDAAFLLFSPHA